MNVVLNGENFVDIFFHLGEIWMQSWGSNEKKALFLGCDNVSILLRGVVAAVRLVINHPKFTIVILLHS